MRKTVKIDDLVKNTNSMLLNLPDEDVSARQAVINLLTQTLHDAKRYHGFRYLDADDMRESTNGATVGINGENGCDMPHKERFAGTDETRVRYF